MSLNFEIAIKELEDVVRKLESGNVNLDDAISLYSKGVDLRDFCTKQLGDAKLKIDTILQQDSGVSLVNSNVE